MPEQAKPAAASKCVSQRILIVEPPQKSDVFIVRPFIIPRLCRNRQLHFAVVPIVNKGTGVRHNICRKVHSFPETRNYGGINIHRGIPHFLDYNLFHSQPPGPQIISHILRWQDYQVGPVIQNYISVQLPEQFLFHQRRHIMDKKYFFQPHIAAKMFFKNLIEPDTVPCRQLEEHNISVTDRSYNPVQPCPQHIRGI